MFPFFSNGSNDPLVQSTYLREASSNSANPKWWLIGRSPNRQLGLRALPVRGSSQKIKGTGHMLRMLAAS